MTMMKNDRKPTMPFHYSSQPITTTQLVKYAGASGDYNRIHFDYPYARENGLRGLLAHGMLTMAIAGTALTEFCGTHYWVRTFDAKFKKPVEVGDEVEVVINGENLGGREVKLAITGTVGNKLVLEGSAEVVSRALNS